jgi:alkylation response protein AidB-like acyl-CoA dehydrogenase
MDFEFTAEQEKFRHEFRTWLEANVPEDLKGDFEPIDSTPPDWESFHKRAAFQKKMYEAGWMGIWWPREYGGRGASLIEQVIYEEEFKRARSPLPVNFAPINQWGPTLIHFGTTAQKQRFLARMLSGEDTWCQGYSEPNAGSDLAALQTRAEDHGDYFILNGQKIWTTSAQFADWMYMLVRSDPSAPKHKGISCIYLDMHSPGVEVRPLVTMSGERHFNEVFFDNVRVPKDSLVGPLNEGWRVAMITLAYERAISGGSGHQNQVNRLKDLARRLTIDGRPANQDAYVRQQLVQLEIECEALKYTGLRALTRQLRGQPAGPELSLMKVAGCDLVLKITRFATELLGSYAVIAESSGPIPETADWLMRVLNVRGTTISGGTTEISRNIIGERTLGLPKST